MKKFLAVLPVLAVIVLVILELTYDDSFKHEEPFPMCNQHITWNTVRN